MSKKGEWVQRADCRSNSMVLCFLHATVVGTSAAASVAVATEAVTVSGYDGYWPGSCQAERLFRFLGFLV